MKRYTIVLSLIFILILCTVSVYGMEVPKDSDVVVIEKAEITDIDQLFLRAKKGITDFDVKPFINNEKALLTNQVTSKELQVYTTGQLLKETKKRNGNIEKIFAVTTIVPLGSGSFTEEEWDSTLAVKAYSTRYWQTTTDSYGMTGYLLTKVTGGWTISDTQVSLSNRTVHYRNNGAGMDNQPSVSQTGTKYPTSNSFSYTTGFTKYAKRADGGLGFALGVETTVKLTRGGSSWHLYLLNYL